jgi:hypothetical protein
MSAPGYDASCAMVACAIYYSIVSGATGYRANENDNDNHDHDHDHDHDHHGIQSQSHDHGHDHDHDDTDHQVHRDHSNHGHAGVDHGHMRTPPSRYFDASVSDLDGKCDTTARVFGHPNRKSSESLDMSSDSEWDGQYWTTPTANLASIFFEAQKRHRRAELEAPTARLQQSNNAQASSVSCACNVKACAVGGCGQCPRCGCECDGLTVAHKLSRKRGRPAVDKPRGVRLSRKTQARKRKPIDVRTPTPTPKKRLVPALRAVLNFFNCTRSKVESMLKHLPRSFLRSSKGFWLDDDDNTKRERASVATVYWHVLDAIAECICGSNAASESLVWFRRSFALATENAVAVGQISNGLQAMAATREGSYERRVIRATLCGMFQRKDLVAAAEDIVGGKIGYTTYAKSRQAYEILLDDGHLEKISYTRTKFDPVVLDPAIRLIMASENVSFLSWGAKRVVLRGVLHDVPSILLKKPPSVICAEYDGKAPPKPNRISRATFYRLNSILTDGHVEPRTTIDYVTGMLINDSMNLLAEVIDECVDMASDLKADLECIQAWLKYGHGRDARADSQQCPRHG